MSSSVGTKSKKNQLSLPDNLAFPDRKLESAILALEDACINVLSAPTVGRNGGSDSLYFVNIANPVSLALMESKGPRHFHYHYRHRPEDASILHPVLENPIEMLAQVCEEALRQCQSHLVGIEDAAIASEGKSLQHALQHFLASYKKFNQKD